MGLFRRNKRNEGRTLEPDAHLSPQTAPAAQDPGAQNIPRRLLSYRIANLQGIGTRQGQEDSFAFVNTVDVSKIREQGMLAVVADGMGGMRDGRLAGETTVNSVRASFTGFDYGESLQNQLCGALQTANDQVYRILGGSGGSTAVVCLFYQGHLYYASVGDSYLFLLHRGQLYRLNRLQTVFHSECADLIRHGSTDPSAPAANPERRALSQFIGMEYLDDIDCFRIPLHLEGEDVVLLCSDGVGDVLSESEIRDCLLLSTPNNTCIGLEKLILSKGRKYQDNYTALVIRCEY